jgi:tetratricopeptide (TPR) repeat protein
VVDYAKSNGDKDILQELALLINMHEPEIEKYKELIDTPFDGDTIEDFGKYLFDNIINISGNYHSSLDDLVEELYDFGLDDEADKLDEIHRMIEDYLEDSFSQISVRIYGCIDNENNIFNYPADVEKNKLNPELMFLKSEEWSFSVIKTLFRESSGNDSFDILNDNWELTWIETGLYNLDDCKNVGNKTYFIVCYVKEFRDSREVLSKQLLSSENSEGETRQEEIPLNIAFEKEREYNDSAWDKMMNGNYKEALDDINKSIKYFSDESNNDTAAMIYFHLKDYKNALKHANVSVKMNDSGIPSPEHLFTRAKILVKLGKTAKAIKDLEDALYWEDDWYDGYEDAKKLLKEIIKIKL